MSSIRKVLTGAGETLDTALSGKQETLISGTNIKTINSNSLLGAGNLVIDTESTKTFEVNGGTLSETITLSSGFEKCFILPDGNDLPGVKEQTYGFSPSFDTDKIEMYLLMASNTQTTFKVRFNEFKIQTAPYESNKTESDNEVARYPLGGFASLDTNKMYTIRKASFNPTVLLVVG